MCLHCGNDKAERLLADAETAYTETLAIRRDLAQRDPGAYRPDVAQTLNNLAVLYRDTGRLADAETAYTEALASDVSLPLGHVKAKLITERRIPARFS